MKLLHAIRMSDFAAQSLRCGLFLTILMVVIHYTGLSAMAAPFCATCALLTLMPKAPFSTPKTIFLSHCICISLAICIIAMPVPILAVVLLTAWLSIIAMSWFRVLHAPAVAHSVILAWGKQGTNQYALYALGTAAGFAILAYLASYLIAADTPAAE